MWDHTILPLYFTWSATPPSPSTRSLLSLKTEIHNGRRKDHSHPIRSTVGLRKLSFSPYLVTFSLLLEDFLSPSRSFTVDDLPNRDIPIAIASLDSLPPSNLSHHHLARLDETKTAVYLRPSLTTVARASTCNPTRLTSTRARALHSFLQRDSLNIDRYSKPRTTTSTLPATRPLTVNPASHQPCNLHRDVFRGVKNEGEKRRLRRCRASQRVRRSIQPGPR